MDSTFKRHGREVGGEGFVANRHSNHAGGNDVFAESERGDGVADFRLGQAIFARNVFPVALEQDDILFPSDLRKLQSLHWWEIGRHDQFDRIAHHGCFAVNGIFHRQPVLRNDLWLLRFAARNSKYKHRAKTQRRKEYGMMPLLCVFASLREIMFIVWFIISVGRVGGKI